MQFFTILVTALAFVEAAKTKQKKPKLRVSVTHKVECERKSRLGDELAMHYVGRLENGKVFDSSLDRGQAFEFPLGSGLVIEGWEKGLRGMCLGEERRLTVPPHMGYGQLDVGSIPPGSTLVFDTILVGINEDTIDIDLEAEIAKASERTKKLRAKAKADGRAAKGDTEDAKADAETGAKDEL